MTTSYLVTDYLNVALFQHRIVLTVLLLEMKGLFCKRVFTTLGAAVSYNILNNLIQGLFACILSFVL